MNVSFTLWLINAENIHEKLFFSIFYHVVCNNRNHIQEKTTRPKRKWLAYRLVQNISKPHFREEEGNGKKIIGTLPTFCKGLLLTTHKFFLTFPYNFFSNVVVAFITIFFPTAHIHTQKSLQ